MSVDVCDRYLQHTWRKDTCANCLKPRKQHGPIANLNPQPAKRLSKSVALRETPSLPDTQAIDEASPEDQMENNSPVRSRQGSGPDAKRLSIVGSPKPAPIKSKPQLISKPEKARKPGTTAADSGEKMGPGPVRKMAEESSLKEGDVRTVTGDNHGEPCDVELDREPANVAQRTTKVRPRPQVTPPQVPDPGKIPNTTKSTNKTDPRTTVKPKPSSNSVDAPDQSTKQLSSSDSKEKSSASHYYQIYDISAKGLSGTPEPVDASCQNGALAESRKRTDSRGSRAGVCRVVDVAEESQNVAMPYTVVDVTVCQPSKDQLVGKAPPQLPLTPAPIRDASSTSLQNNTLPTNRPWSTREGSDPLRHTTPKAGHPSIDQCPVESLSSARGAAVLPLDGKFLVGKMANQDLYEDIAGSNDDERKNSSFVSSSGTSEVNPAQSGTIGKSSALEAKMAALSKLDLSRAIVPQGTSTLPTRMDDTKPDAAGDRQDPGETSDDRVGEIATVITLNRQEKGRKSGGKSFFQKFLKRGNKETTFEVQSRTTSLSIEPILNTTSPAALGQSSLEPVTRGSLPVGGDSLGSFPSPSKLSSNKPPSLPVASPSKKTQPMNGVSEAGDSSGNSSISSSDDWGKIPEKATFAQPSEKPFSDKDDSTSGDFPRVTPFKPPVSVLSDNVTTEVGVTSHPLRESLTAARDKLKSCSSLSRIPDGMKPTEDKMSFADSLRDALALKMSEKDAAGTAAALDASPTADGADQAPLNCLNSEKCKVQKDAPKPSKAPRKMMAPPPMAPPPPPPCSSAKDQDAPGNSSSPKHAGNTASDTDDPSRSLSPSFHGSSTLAGRRTKPGDSVRGPAPTFPLSNTLPRKSSSSSNASSTELKVLGGAIGLRQLDSAAKHARNKTVSEGVRFETLLITPQEGEEKKRSEDATIESETLDRRASKFLNRALPAPPPKEESSPDRETGPDEIDNLYELVSQSIDPARDKISADDEQLTYEDIDLCCAKANNDTGSKASSTSSSTGVQATNQKQGTGSDPSPGSGFYLEPVGGKEELGRGVKDDWRPCPAPRGSKPGPEHATGAMPYVNTRMINGQLPLNASDGFDAMAGLVANMLYHLTDRLYSGYVTRLLRNRTDVVWTDFELLDWTPRIEQEAATFYRAKHLVLAPSGCILTVARDRQGSSFSLEPTHANVVSPLLCFAMTASDLEALNGSTSEGSSRNATAAVLLCYDIATLDGFWEREHAKALDQSAVLAFEQSVCLCLVQMLNALLYLRDSGCTVLRMTSDDVIMALSSSSDARWHPLVKPSAMTFDVCSDLDSAFLGEDVAQLLLSQMLRTDPGKSSETKGVPALTRYSRGLQRVLRTLAVPRTWEGLETGRNLLEFILWGPSEEEAKLVAMTDKRDTSFRVWLEVARCRMASELVLEPDRNSLELADQARFLCRVTENSLLGVTKLLFE